MCPHKCNWRHFMPKKSISFFNNVFDCVLTYLCSHLNVEYLHENRSHPCDHVNHLEASESGNLCTLNFREGHLRATAIWIDCASVSSWCLQQHPAFTIDTLFACSTGEDKWEKLRAICNLPNWTDSI